MLVRLQNVFKQQENLFPQLFCTKLCLETNAWHRTKSSSSLEEMQTRSEFIACAFENRTLYFQLDATSNLKPQKTRKIEFHRSKMRWIGSGQRTIDLFYHSLAGLLSWIPTTWSFCLQRGREQVASCRDIKRAASNLKMYRYLLEWNLFLKIFLRTRLPHASILVRSIEEVVSRSFCGWIF